MIPGGHQCSSEKEDILLFQRHPVPRVKLRKAKLGSGGNAG
jgi:hypothetical protein